MQVAITWEKSGSTATIYKNGGESKQTISANNGNCHSTWSLGGLKSYNNHNSPVYIGRVIGFSKVLTDSEIGALYNEQKDSYKDCTGSSGADFDFNSRCSDSISTTKWTDL